MRYTIVVAALALSGCASTYHLSVMPRDSGRMYAGSVESSGYGGEGRISITIEDKTYNGTWVQTSPDHTTGYVSGGVGYGWGGWGRHGWGGIGLVTMDNPYGGSAKALLSAADGSGLRCDLRSSQGLGGGVCRDDRGREYDVQLRPAPRG